MISAICIALAIYYKLRHFHIDSLSNVYSLCNQSWQTVLLTVGCSDEGWSGLVEEIQMEIDRISFRNLGRDDRVISDHGREVRAPYLDEKLVHFLCSLPMPLKARHILCYVFANDVRLLVVAFLGTAAYTILSVISVIIVITVVLRVCSELRVGIGGVFPFSAK